MEGFQVTLFLAILGMGFPLHKPYPYSFFWWGFLHFRFLKCLVIDGGNSNIFFIFTPKIVEDEPILTNIFQMGWNHQLESHPLS